MSYQNTRAQVLADRLLVGSNSLATLARELSEEEWNMPVHGDGRSIGVVIHHVAHVYPLEIELAQVLASGKAITGATKEVVDQMNAEHAIEFAEVDKESTIALLLKNSQEAASAVRAFSNVELDQAALVSLNSNAPLTAQFFIEDHALRHSYHHMSKIKQTLELFPISVNPEVNHGLHQKRK
ncbi:DinB family protein [Reichenbachiella ulvae]|uniref:DinB-like domain-containing protein n=1 Tax=Reichenbachiella ulvae TaxID=2980104 RepID=A0ABT3CRN8_9BACT|nr:DinB family protein [Reichenbachiella ulvae]MCV9385933.1 hypothetical protein [Reichenbachiella ulvae]